MYEKFGLFSYDLTKFMEMKLWTITTVCDRYGIVIISIWNFGCIKVSYSIILEKSKGIYYTFIQSFFMLLTSYL